MGVAVKWGAASDRRWWLPASRSCRHQQQSFLLANAVITPGGRRLMMAFQAGGPACAGFVRWKQSLTPMRDEAPCAAGELVEAQGSRSLVLDKSWRIVPRGISLVIGCATFPTGTAIQRFSRVCHRQQRDHQAHPGAILPLAITARLACVLKKRASIRT